MNYFGIVDYIVLGVTLFISLLIGAYFTYTSNKTNEDLHVGGRKLAIFPVAASILVGHLSAITVIGYPSEIFYFGSQVFLMQLVASIVIPLSTYVFIPYFHSMKLTSVFEYLQIRYQSVTLRRIASFVFLYQQLITIAVILYAPSIAVEVFFGFPMEVSILSIGICATVYTSFGGLKAVVYTDLFQFFMILGGMLAIVIRGFIVSGSVGETFKIAYEFDRLNLFDFEFNPFVPHNFFNLVVGSASFFFIQTGVDQRIVQRYGAMSTVNRARASIITSVPLKVIVHVLCIITGLAIFAVYAECDPLILGEIDKHDSIVPYFVVKELVFIPGMLGLFASCIFCAVLSSISSSINSMVAVTFKDFFNQSSCTQNMSETSQANISRVIGIIYGILMIVLAFAVQYLGPVWTGIWKAVSPSHGALGGIFILSLFVPFANKYGAFTGMVSALAVLSYISVQSFIMGHNRIKLQTTVDKCPYDESRNASQMWANVNVRIEEDPTFPENIYQLSYILYQFVGVIITVVVGILVSICTGGICTSKVNEKYPWALHPWVRSGEGRRKVNKIENEKKKKNNRGIIDYHSVENGLNESKHSLDKGKLFVRSMNGMNMELEMEEEREKL